MSASGSYLHTEAPEFSNSDLDSFMNPMIRQAQPSLIGVNNPGFMPQPPGPQHHMGLTGNPGGPNPPMGMLPSGPEMRFPQGHNPMMARTMGMRPTGRPPMAPGGIPGGMPMSGLAHNPQMQGGMAFPPNMMPSGPGGMVRRAVSNPTLNPGLNGLSGPMIQQQMARQQMQMQQQQHAQQQERQRMEMAMLNARGQPGNPQNSAASRSGSAGQLMSSLSQPASLSQPPHPGGIPGPHNFQSPIVPPPQSSSPRARTPVMNIPPSGPGPSQPPLNRAHMSDEMFINFQQNQYPPRMGNGPFPFGTSPTPPLNMSDSYTPSVGTPGRPGGFPPTPAQQLSMQQQHGGAAGAENGFGFPMAPQRPPSNNQHPMMQQQHSPPQQPSQHHSPHHSDPMNAHPPRPQSQPQPQQPPGRPLSGAGPSHTPRPAQQGLPNNPGLLPPGRLPQAPPQPPNPNMRPQSSSGTPSHNQPIAPRPPQPAQQTPTAPSSTDGTLMSASASPPDANAILTNPIPRPVGNPQTYSIGYGQGLIRVMQFSGLLGSDTPTVQSQKLHLSYWDNLIREYFTPKAIMKLTLWRDSLKNEAKPFEIGVPILPRFFLVTTQSGVKSMSLTLDGARERLFQPGHAIVECVSAIWTCRYSNGHIVTLRGPLTAHLVICAPHPQGTTLPANGVPNYVLKFDDFEFDAHSHDKYIALESIAGTRRTEEVAPPPANGSGSGSVPGADEDKKWEEPRQIIENGSIPGEPVNAFGIPQATMRCLELAESVGQMADLISFAKEQDVGPLDALRSFADKIREQQPQLAMMNSFGTNPFFQAGGSSMPSSAQGNTLYSSAPPSVTNPAASSAQQPSSSMSSPQNAPPSAHNSPQKQHKTIPSKGSVASASTPGTSTTNNTPAMASAPLKRKAGPGDTSTTTTEPPSKRMTRQRRGTKGGG